MADPAGPAGPNHPGTITRDNTLKYAFDAGFLSGASPPDDSTEDTKLEARDQSSDSESECSDSDTESRSSDDLAASLRVFSESMLRMELVELERIKARETSRLEAEKRHLELETQLTQMMAQSQLQIASLLSQKRSNRKRKRSDDLNSSIQERDGAVLLGLLQCNLI